MKDEEIVVGRVMRHFILLAFLVAADLGAAVRITDKPTKLVHGTLYVPIEADAPATQIALFVNGVRHSVGQGTKLTAQVNVGLYIRRLRMRAVAWDAQGNVVGEDEMVVNDPRPPFRVRLQAPATLPESGNVTVTANVIRPTNLAPPTVEFYVGEEKVGSSNFPPYTATFDAARFPGAVYTRVVARSGDEEANDIIFFGDRARELVDVTVQQIPVSVASGETMLRAEDLTLYDNGAVRKIESLVKAEDQPLYLILLIDYSESMLEELPVVKQAAKGFAQAVLRPRDRIAVVGFNQRTFWLTGFTNDFNAAAAAVDRVKPIGETHLYDTIIEMLYELQKHEGRTALVVLTDGVDQGSAFKLDHLIHYAKYAGVPVYPVVKNKLLTRAMRFGIGYLQARRLAGIARDTGATYFIINSERQLPEVYSRIARELRQQYQLVFYSDPSAEDEWHSLRIESRGKHSLRIPRGYFP